VGEASAPGPSADELRDTVDEVAIRALIAAYADVVNRRAWPELGDLFVPDAPVELDLRQGEPRRWTGPREIGDFIAGAIERFAFFEFVALNVRVGLRAGGDPDRATVHTWMCELRQDHAGTPSRAFGLYQDVVVRDRARARHWRFAARRYQSVARGESSLDLLPPPVID
jgi:hypothetical protein